MKTTLAPLRNNRKRIPAARPRTHVPRLLAHSLRRMTVTCGCGRYYQSSCGINHSSSTDTPCGHYYSSSCGLHHSSI